MLIASEQLQLFKRTLEGQNKPRSHPVFNAVITWLRSFPGDLPEEDKREIMQLVRTCFALTQEELIHILAGGGDNGQAIAEQVAEAERQSSRQIEDSLWALIPRDGFFHRYADFTRHSEAPLAYHLLSALVGVGATVNRRVYFDMGYYRVYPALGVIILGPSGIKKTSAANIMVAMLQELELTKIYSEKLTPEALVEAMKDTAQGLIYAPEMSVFLGKQQYNEGLIPLITRFMDCPDVWESGTIMRGKHVLRNVAISSLMCSTVDWFVRNTPEDTFGGGFIARNILMAQEVSPRIEPIPRPGDPRLRKVLMNELAQIHEFEGEMIMSERAMQRYKDWYGQHKLDSEAPEHELLATYYQRKPDHAKRIAILLHLAEHRDLTMCMECFERAVSWLDWIEKFLPATLRQMFKTQMGEEHEYIVRLIRKAGGTMDHSDLVRRVQYKMAAGQLRTLIASLLEAKQIKEYNDKLIGHGYAIIQT